MIESFKTTFQKTYIDLSSAANKSCVESLVSLPPGVLAIKAIPKLTKLEAFCNYKVFTYN